MVQSNSKCSSNNSINEPVHLHGIIARCHGKLRTVSTFTTVDMLWSRQEERWLSGVEKLASLGFAVLPEIAEKYGVVSSLQIKMLFGCHVLNVRGKTPILGVRCSVPKQ